MPTPAWTRQRTNPSSEIPPLQMSRFAPNAYTTLDIQLTTYYSDKLTPTHKLVDSDPSHIYVNFGMDLPVD